MALKMDTAFTIGQTVIGTKDNSRMGSKTDKELITSTTEINTKDNSKIIKQKVKAFISFPMGQDMRVNLKKIWQMAMAPYTMRLEILNTNTKGSFQRTELRERAPCTGLTETNMKGSLAVDTYMAREPCIGMMALSILEISL